MIGKKKPDLPLIIGDAILYSSISFAIGSVAMSSVYSIRNFTKDQRTLDNGVCAFKDYLVIALVWAIGVTLILYSTAKMRGLIAALVSN
jgi:hypothetical protein